MVDLGFGGFAVFWGASGVWGAFGGLGGFMGPDLRKSESSKPEELPAPGRKPREEANEVTSDFSASMSSSPPAAGFFAFLVDFALGFGSTMDGCGGYGMCRQRRGDGRWDGKAAGTGESEEEVPISRLGGEAA